MEPNGDYAISLNQIPTRWKHSVLASASAERTTIRGLSFLIFNYPVTKWPIYQIHGFAPRNHHNQGFSQAPASWLNH
jgi:hypothetical protein